MPGRTPTKAVIAAEERGLLERQRAFRFAADRVTAALARCREVEAIALIGSVARPLRREVPRFAPYRQLRLPIAHDCKDVDLAAWVSRVDGLDELRRARAVPATRLSPSAAMGRRCMKSRFSCLSRTQTAISVDFASSGNARQASAIVLLPGAANINSSSNTTTFRSGRKQPPKAPPFGSTTASAAGSSHKLSIYRWSFLMLIRDGGTSTACANLP